MLFGGIEIRPPAEAQLQLRALVPGYREVQFHEASDSFRAYLILLFLVVAFSIKTMLVILLIFTMQLKFVY